MKDLKLKIELVPKTAHYANFRNAVPRSVWEKIAKKTKEGQGNKCGICGDQGHRLNCHEIWEYDDSHFIYTLVGFISLCGYCHAVKHMGFTKTEAFQWLDLEEVIEHFCQVNGCTKTEFKEHETAAFVEYHVRSQYKWEPDFGEYSNLLTKPIDKRITVIGFDSESDTRDFPFMFTFSDGEVCSLDELLDILFSRKYRGVKFVCYNLKYDEGSILHILPENNLKELRELGKCQWGEYKFRSIPKKELVISRKHQSVAFYDIAQFFALSLDNAAKTYLGKKNKTDVKVKKFTPDYINQHYDSIASYSIYDAQLTKELADYFIDLLIKDLGIYPKKLYFARSYLIVDGNIRDG